MADMIKPYKICYGKYCYLFKNKQDAINKSIELVLRGENVIIIDDSERVNDIGRKVFSLDRLL